MKTAIICLSDIYNFISVTVKCDVLFEHGKIPKYYLDELWFQRVKPTLCLESSKLR
jgi:hypothetical protein